jgi:hypothetical protein
MLSMNGIIVCELILGGVLMSLIFTSLANADVIADPSLKSKSETQSDSFKTATQPGLSLTNLSPDVHKPFSGGPLSQDDVRESATSGK